MTLCPVALAVGCKRCPIFAVCPAKSIIGDQPAAAEPEPAAKAASKPSAKRKARKSKR
ncbi:MAG: hypothetical protein KA763_10085 [Xanthomonadales bacterium]|jgi:hypothetical protein|nr:hypothetical protein [Xanthomonadales bacterium]